VKCDGDGCTRWGTPAAAELIGIEPDVTAKRPAAMVAATTV
jgi:hypothetical protein